MADETKNRGGSPGAENEDDDTEAAEARAFILARRARFVAAALASAGIVTAACGGETNDGGNPQPCLDIVQNGGGMSGHGGASTGGNAAAGGAQPCLSIFAESGGAFGMGGAQVCLGALPGGAPGSGGYPQVCLEPPLQTGGVPGAGGYPQVCLAPPLTGGTPGAGGAGGTPVDGGPDAEARNTGGKPRPCLIRVG
jgi:hypothetical protein